MLFLIGTGLCDAKDLTQRGLEAINNSGTVYIEDYTSLLQCSHEELEKTIGKSVKKLSRTDVEQDIEPILETAKEKNVTILVIGDPFCATTHSDLYLRAKSLGVEITVIHNASIMNAIGSIGLELYRYGKAVSIPYWSKGYEPTSFINGIEENLERGLHTLCLLDIKKDEGKFMTISEGISYLEKSGSIPEKLLGVARIGCPDQKIVFSSREYLKTHDMGKPPHAIVIPGKLHPVEEEMLSLWQQSL